MLNNSVIYNVKSEGPNHLDQDVLVSVNQVSKKFCRSLKRSYIYGLKDITRTLTGRTRNSHILRKQEFWALDNVSFDLKRGQGVGLVGLNGSGKTTLLKIINGLLKPDTGSVRVRGRVTALIALGAGFNPILTGRENVYINMSILGLSTEEIDANYESVLAFAEIGDAINAPVRTYSSGMRARLGFACSIHTRPDILLIDEILAVGDYKFRTKCYRKLAELREQGTAVIMVSHNANVILNACDQALYLSKGKVVMSGDSRHVTDRYEADITASEEVENSPLYKNAHSDDENFNILSLCFKDKQGNVLNHLYSGELACLCIQYRAKHEFEKINLNLIVREIQKGNDQCVLNLSSERDGELLDLREGENELHLTLPYCGFKPGIYEAKVFFSERPFYIHDMVESFRFQVKGRNMSSCLFYQPRLWNTLPDTYSDR
jgi:lipopolysaccharide transport system ATP-binding protein